MTVPDEEKIHIASNLLLLSPPGEINDVFNDVRVLVDNDDLLQNGISPAFRDYNTQSYVSVKLPGKQHQVIISKHNELEEGRYVDPKSKSQFQFDHMTQEVSDVQPYASDSDLESTRSALQDAMDKYTADHYPEGVVSVFDKGQELVICIVATKYSPNNFWNGRWQSTYTVNISSKKVVGVTKILVHYYEDGNVQSHIDKSVEFDITGATEPTALSLFIQKNIQKIESQFQLSLNESYAHLSDTTFKALRRALPVFRTRIDWNTIGGYKLKNELPSKT